MISVHSTFAHAFKVLQNSLKSILARQNEMFFFLANIQIRNIKDIYAHAIQLYIYLCKIPAYIYIINYARTG